MIGVCHHWAVVRAIGNAVIVRVRIKEVGDSVSIGINARVVRIGVQLIVGRQAITVVIRLRQRDPVAGLYSKPGRILIKASALRIGDLVLVGMHPGVIDTDRRQVAT